MAVLKCKMCGGDLMIQPGSTVVECEYCGTRQTVPNADNEKKMVQFERAERLRRNCEFDKAASVYENIVAEFSTEPEAYWGLVLCKYGIEYVDDPATGKKVPTCHRSSFESVMEDKDFEQACENADSIARKVYREEAKQIEEIRKGIIEVSGKEDPYDIFICYKETDENGERTLDSVIAQDAYDALTGKGYRVFFSRITLEDKLGQEYEPYIFAALNSAKIMLAFGTDYEYYNAVWVKNEWSRYLKLMERDRSKHLIPCYKNIDAYDMPKEFAKFQAQDMGKVGAMQDLLRGVEKILKTPVPKEPSVQKGMNAEEKRVFESVKKGQQTTKLILFLVLFGVGAFMISMVLRDYDIGIFAPEHILAIVHGKPKLLGEYIGTPLPLAIPMVIAIPISVVLAYGWKSKGANLANLIVLVLLDVLAIYMRITGIRIGEFCKMIYAITAIIPAITAWTSNPESKKRIICFAAVVICLGIALAL